MKVTRKAGDATRGPADRFAGDVWIWPRIGATEHTEVRVVLFTPGARTAWHRHPGGQVLHVTEGAGLVQSRGGVRAEVRAGDAVTAAPGEWHWHGAALGTFMVHLAVSDGMTEWAEQVTDDEYRVCAAHHAGPMALPACWRSSARFCVSWPSVIMRTNATDMAIQLAEERNEQHRPDDDRRTSRSARGA